MANRDFSKAKDVIIVQAKLKLLLTEEGGRQAAIVTGYRPNHVFEYLNGLPAGTYIGEIQFEDNLEIKPGEVAIVTVYFLRSPKLLPNLTIGRKWWIHEGSRLVGSGEILSLKPS